MNLMIATDYELEGAIAERRLQLSELQIREQNIELELACLKGELQRRQGENSKREEVIYG